MWDGCAQKKVIFTLRNELKNFFWSFSVEADDEMKNIENSRGLSDEERKETPSQLMNTLDRGLNGIVVLFTGADDE